MNVSIRSCLSSGIAVASVGAFALVPMAPEVAEIGAKQSRIALTAQVRPLVATTPLPSPQQFAGLLNEQAAFHVDLAVDFVVTGAQLVSRQVPVPGTLVRDIQNGTPLPVAVSRALRTLADVEVDAGRELVGFAAQYVDFQIRFATGVLQDAVVLATAVPAAVGGLMTSSVAGMTPAPDAALVASSDTDATSRIAEVAISRSPSDTSVGATTNTETRTRPSLRSRLVDALTTVRDRRRLNSETATQATDADGAKSTETERVGAGHRSRADVSDPASQSGAEATHTDGPGQQTNRHDRESKDDANNDTGD